MYSLSRFLLLTAVLLEAHLVCLAQPQWRFHLAFEDATGARDTIWFIFDENATQGLDEELGEVNQQTDASLFTVWIEYYEPDTIKTRALPFSLFPDIGAHIMGANYEYPITLSWDTSLFNYTAANLPWPGYFPGAQLYCDYIFFNHENQFFNMFEANFVVIEEPMLFTLIVRLGLFLPMHITRQDGPEIEIKFERDRLILYLKSSIDLIRVMDSHGRTVAQESNNETAHVFDTSAWASGVYFIQTLDKDGAASTKKCVISR